MNLLTYKPIFTCFHKKASNIVFFIAFLFGILLSENVLAQNEGRWYSVEVLVFKRLGSEAFAQENWPTNIDLSYPSFYQQLKVLSQETSVSYQTAAIYLEDLTTPYEKIIIIVY
jgi:hypothetical protein